MHARIQEVHTDSIAQDLGLVPGDTITAINGQSQLEDLLDYQFEVQGSEEIELTVEHSDGTEEIFEIEKDPEDDLGLVFESPLFTPIKTCNNACPFCFIDQQPEGLRKSLYVKDDDYRLSYFNNTYITLTNLTQRDKERIARLRPGPLYVSVHATDPEVRKILLMNKKAPPIMEMLGWLKNLEIPFHCQVVLCPGINDGSILDQTMAELATLKPEALSVAVVPVGLTQYRGELSQLTAVTDTVSHQVIDQVEAFNKTQLSATTENEPFVYLSDEFYIKAGRPFPVYSEYGEFPQLDDGVGTARMLLSDFFNLIETLPASLKQDQKSHQLWLTGKLGAMILKPIADRLNQVEGLFIDLLPIENHFWGQSVDVAGLVTGQDIQTTLKKQTLSNYDRILLPSVMLRHGSDLFLDGLTVANLADEFKTPFIVIKDPYSAEELLETVFN